MSSNNLERDKAIIIAAALIEKDEKLLMVQEGREDVKGKWNLPAGHADLGEDPIKAVIREAKEETGLDVKPVSLAGIVAFEDKSGSSGLRFHFNCEVRGVVLKNSQVKYWR
jgi:ADP-ribose pyrophosphatase YjhB (NUDIX family)